MTAQWVRFHEDRQQRFDRLPDGSPKIGSLTANHSSAGVDDLPEWPPMVRLPRVPLHRTRSTRSKAALTADDVRADIHAIFAATSLASIRRYFHQPYWEAESLAACRAEDVEGPLRLESVADHSWKVADSVLLLADHFPEVDRARAVELAVAHDKLELLTGDLSPIDDDATGRTTHAFNPARALAKRRAEWAALETYLGGLRPSLRPAQRELFGELLAEQTANSRFVKALDKLASLVFVVESKDGVMRPEHVQFTIAYAAKGPASFPGLGPHYDALVEILLDRVNERRLEAGPVTRSQGDHVNQHRPVRALG